MFTGAHTRPKDPVAWLKVADLVLECAGTNRAAALKDAIYCYSRVIDIDHKNYQIRFDRAAAYHELGHKGRAALEYERLLKDLPHNMEALRSLARIYIELNEVEKARLRYEESISHYIALPLDETSGFDWSDINIYIELFGYLKEYEQGIAALKFLSRWFLGRQDDSRWDDVTEDDREFDAEDTPRRQDVSWFTPGQYPVEAYGLGLPLELRIKLGVYRLNLGPDHVDEALVSLHNSLFPLPPFPPSRVSCCIEKYLTHMSPPIVPFLLVRATRYIFNNSHRRLQRSLQRSRRCPPRRWSLARSPSLL